MKKLSKIISMLMAFALVMGLALTPAFAAVLTAESFDENGTLAAGDYEMNGDIVLKGNNNHAYYVSTGDTRIDTKGFKLDLGANSLVADKAGTSLTITSSATTNGEIVSTNNLAISISVNGNATSITPAAIVVANGAEFKADHVEITGNGKATENASTDNTKDERGISSLLGGKVDFNQVNVTSKDTGIFETNNASLIATDVTVSSSDARGIGVQDGSTATVNGGEINGGDAVFVSNGSEVTLNGTKVTGADERAAVVMSETTGKENAPEPTLTLSAGTTLNNGIRFGKRSNPSDKNVTDVGGKGYTGTEPEQTVGTIIYYREPENSANVELPAEVKAVGCPKDNQKVETEAGTWTAKVEVTDGEGNTKSASVTWNFEPAPTPAYVYVPVQAANAEIEEPDIPLAGMVTVKELVGYLYEREGYELPAAPEDSNELYDYAPAMAWAVEAKIVDEDVDPDEIVTVGIAEDILNAYAAVFASKPDLGFVIDGEDDDVIDDIQAVLKDFLAQLKG